MSTEKTVAGDSDEMNLEDVEQAGSQEALADELPLSEQDETAAAEYMNPKFRWYIVNTFSGSEETVRATMKERILKSELEESFGEICIPKMITNITTFNRRTDIIYMLLERCVKEGRKTLVLSDRRDHLKYIYNMVNDRELASIGYYIGGMKELELKCSEDKDILLGTYAMSSEGMDIPSLNTLIMASPKGEIEQSVGRILRKKHAITPIVYDIVDDFSIFTGQYLIILNGILDTK